MVPLDALGRTIHLLQGTSRQPPQPAPPPSHLLHVLSLQPQTTARRTNLLDMAWIFLPYHHPLTMQTFYLLQNHHHPRFLQTFYLLQNLPHPRFRRVRSWPTFSMTRHVNDLHQPHSNSHFLSNLPHITCLLPRMVGLSFELWLSQISLRSWIA